MVGVSYNGASVMPIDPRDMNGTGMVGQAASMKKRADSPALLQTYMFVGRIDDDKMKDNMTMADLEGLIMPILTLTAKNSTGSTIRTNVSINEAAFLTGVFSRDVVMSDFSMAQAAVDEQVAGLKNGTCRFRAPRRATHGLPHSASSSQAYGSSSLWPPLGLAPMSASTTPRCTSGDSRLPFPGESGYECAGEETALKIIKARFLF
ncbi:hypothetical protein NM208_g13060 [Fusarium decemcellulare]|uniref:Uncharacterized protein n=1 Tax=Fusarium decemcellulare TaxID=57161 RepID=A0ACC1RMM1_9HYPO|nr:hypothetical protein NM208_g13060 [Fusarium decemcellulare]